MATEISNTGHKFIPLSVIDYNFWMWEYWACLLKLGKEGEREYRKLTVFTKFNSLVGWLVDLNVPFFLLGKNNITKASRILDPTHQHEISE